MRLHVAVLEGDYVVTSHLPFGYQVAWRMTDMKEFGNARKSTLDDTRWKLLDAEILSRTCSVEAEEGTLIADLMNIALKAARATGLVRSVGIDTWLTDPATDMRLDPALTVESANLEDGDLVVLCVMNEPLKAYLLMPAPSPEKFFSQLELSENIRHADEVPRLHGVLLYTEADIELAAFVRTHFDELNTLSGSLLRIFVMERPTDWAIAKKYWKSRMEPELYRSLAALRWLSWKPYEKARAHDIARQFGIAVSDIPCLVLFSTHRDDRKFAFPIIDASARTFRRLFSAISEIVEGRGFYNEASSLQRGV